MRFTGKTALITGGSQGIGRCVAERLAAEGAHVGVIASTNLSKAQEVVDKIGSDGGKSFPLVMDIADEAAVKECVDATIRAHGKIDILINCAGVFYPTPVDGRSLIAVERMVDINLMGTYRMINAVVPLMVGAGGGKIVNISSVAGMMGMKEYGIYCATKAAIILLTRALALELAPSGININAIAPGNTATPMNEDIRTQPELAHFLGAMAARTPSGRTYSTPDEMAGMVTFLCSEDARSMHGSTVLMDEGFSAGI